MVKLKQLGKSSEIALPRSCDLATDPQFPQASACWGKFPNHIQPQAWWQALYTSPHDQLLPGLGQVRAERKGLSLSQLGAAYFQPNRDLTPTPRKGRLVRLEGQNKMALFPLSLETAAPDRVPRLLTHPSSKTSLEGGIAQLLSQLSLRGATLLLPRLLAFLLQPSPSRASAQAPSTACVQEPWPHLGQSFSPAAIQDWLVIIALAEGVPHLPASQKT